MRVAYASELDLVDCARSCRAVRAGRSNHAGLETTVRQSDCAARCRSLVTLEDAGDYITLRPKADQQLDEWQTAIECLMLVVKLRGPTMFARIGILKALNRNVERMFDPTREDRRWG